MKIISSKKYEKTYVNSEGDMIETFETVYFCKMDEDTYNNEVLREVELNETIQLIEKLEKREIKTEVKYGYVDDDFIKNKMSVRIFTSTKQ